MSKSPKVSIVSITYNQEDYIRDTLEGFIRQQTNFDFEAIVADDCSTDGTPQIIAEYAKRYPNIIKPILRKQNLGIQKNCINVFQATIGEYVAFCEGDDFWSDPMKLQKQVDFMDDHPDHALCFHPVKVFFENKEQQDYIYPDPDKKTKFTTSKLLRSNFIQSNSVMYRRQNYDSLPTNVMPLDWYLHLYHAQFGKVGFIDQVMAAYRRQDNGVWWNAHKDQTELWKTQGLGYIALFVEVLKIYGGTEEYNKIIESQIIDMFNRLITVDAQQDTNKISEALDHFPEAAKIFMLKQNEALRHDAVIGQSMERTNKALADRSWRLSTDLSRSMEQALAIRASKSYKTGYLLLHPWEAPRKLVAGIKHAAQNKKAKVVNRLDVSQIERQYKKVHQIISTRNNPEGKKVAVVLHLYYPDLWDYFNDRLKSLNRANFDLFVSVPADQKTAATNIVQDFPEACVVFTPNRGRDVLPFLKIMHGLNGKGYEYVLKIHSKKSKHRSDGKTWLRDIVNSLLPTDPELLKEIQKTLARKQTGLIGPTDQYLTLPVNYEANKVFLRRVVANVESPKIAEEVDLHRFKYGFFAGTMFWARIDAVQDVVSYGRHAELFELEQGQTDHTFAHAMERAFSLIPELAGKKIYGISATELRQLDYQTDNVPTWADVYWALSERD